VREDVWQLHHGDVVVADLHVTDGDLPWLNARVVRREGFEAVAGLFEEELRLLEEIDVEAEAWTAAYGAIRAQTRLTDPRGADVREYLLHISGEDAWWRWSDEPFDEADA
jgi:hypothetical protein